MKTVQLGDVASFIRGVTFKPSDVLDRPTGTSVGVMRTKNVQEELDTSDILQIPRHLVRRPEQYLRSGDVLVSSANSWNLVGRCSWVPELAAPAAIGGFVTALRVASDQLEPRYLYRWFSSPRTQAEARNSANQTTNIANLNLKRCEALKIPLPPLDEQRRIAAILDQADSLRTMRRESFRLNSALQRAIFDDMFGGMERREPLGDVTTSMRNGVSPSKSGTARARVLTLTAITGGRFNPAAVKESTFAEVPARDQRVSSEDFLICRGNGNRALVGVGVYPGEDRPELVFPDTVIAARFDGSRVDPIFLEAAWSQPATRQQIEAVARTTNGTFKVNQQTLSGVEIPVPALERQRRYRDIVNRIPLPSAQELDELFAALQARVFSGQL